MRYAGRTCEVVSAVKLDALPTAAGHNLLLIEVIIGEEACGYVLEHNSMSDCCSDRGGMYVSYGQDGGVMQTRKQR